MADTVPQFLAKTAKMGHELRTLEHRTVEIAALAVKTSVLGQMQIAGVDNGRLRGVGKRGAKIGVRYDFGGRTTALVRATGPFHLLESDTKTHRIPKERGARARKRVVVIPGVGVRAFAQSRGTKGKHPWAKGVVAAMPIQEKAQGLALHQALVKAYR
jgi:hypothetical protein